MRVLFCTLPQKTHFLTMVPLAWALRTAGHEVRVASLPGFTDVITEAGLTAAPVGWDPPLGPDDPAEREAIRRGLPKPYDVTEQLPGQVSWTPELRESYEIMVHYAFGEDNSPMMTGLVELARYWRPDLVLWEPFTYAGPIAAKACNAAHGRMLFTMDVLGVTHEWVAGLGVEDPLVGWLTRSAREHRVEFSPDLVSGQFTVDQLPVSLRLAADLRYLPMRYVPYGGRGAVPRWLWTAGDRPRMALTLGLSATEYFDSYTMDVSDVFDGLADLEVEVVATIAERQQEKLGSVPDNVRLVTYVPLEALAPTCTAAIHHGGFGTLTTFALHGVPQLALPYHFEGPLLSGRLAAQGAGLAVHSDLATGTTVREAALRLLREPVFRERAAALRDEIRALPTPNELVPQLEELAAKHHTDT